MNKQIINTSLVVMVWYIILLQVVNWTVQNKLFTPTFPYANELLAQYGSKSLTTWANFDGIHYITIINKGYVGTGLIQAFFPVYPGLIKLFTFNGLINSITMGICISLASILISLLILYKLISMDESKLVAKKTTWLLLFFPTSFFFAAVYTESLFLMLILLCFYFSRTRRWWLAGIIAALASATRLVGIFLWPAIIWEFFQVNQLNKKKSLTMYRFVNLLPLLLPALGLLSFMGYLQLRFGDPLLFLHVQSQFGANRETERLILLYQVFYRYLRMLFTVDRNSMIFPTIIQEFAAGIIGTVGSLISMIKLRPSYAIFAVLSFITPTLTGTFSSLPRYLLTIFPIFILGAKYMPKWFYNVWIVISTLLLIRNLMLFTQGIWVA